MAHPFLELKDPPSFARAKPSPPLNLQELPTELLESIFLYLTPETLLTCSRAASRFYQVIDSVGFFDLYCKTTLQAPWVTSDMVLRTKGVFHKVLQMWYLQNITLCHPNVIFKNWNKLLSIGLLKYAINMWLVSNMSISYKIPIEDEKSDVRIFEIYDKDAKSLFIKLAVLFPKFIEMTLFNVRTASFGVGNPYILPFIMFKTDILERGYLDNFDCKYHFEIICRYPTEDCDWHRPAVVILVGKDSWIGWCGSVEKFIFRFTDTWGSCKLALNAPITDTQKAFRDTFTRFVQIPENVGLSHYLYDCFNVKVTHTLKALLGSAVVGVPLWEKHSSLMEDLARKIERKLERLKLPQDRMKLLQHYLDDCLQQRSISGQSVKRKPSKTCYVAILRYLHRILNNVFYPECMCYLGNVQCCRYLALTRMGDKLLSNIRMTHADTARDVIESYCEHFSVHHLPPKLWPTHLLSHAITAAPVCAKVAQLDVMLWTKGLHCMPVTDKTICFIAAQAETCGLMTRSRSQMLSLKQCPPLGGLIRYCHHGDDTVYRRL